VAGCDHRGLSTPLLTPLAAAVLRVPRYPERVLVVGCGHGEAALFLAREFPPARVRGVDPSEALIREAIARVGLDPEGRLAFKVGRAAALPYPDDLFDLVAQMDSRPSVGEIARVLRPGGHLILARSSRPRGPFSQSPARLQRRLARRGIEQIEAAEAGKGDFFVGRLCGRG
jgi:ubiquinone/menaquinone biosynthesis C-methylase UbiE